MVDRKGLRQRKKSNNRKKKDSERKEEEEDRPPPPTEKEETLSEVFFKHPLTRVAPFVLLPYIVWHSIYFFRLQRPDFLPFLNLRPAIGQQEQRQVLILGSEMSENRYVTLGMGKILGLEIVQEAFDAQKYFCRDGSVSWFQIMRFLEASRDTQAAQIDTWKELCIDRNTSLAEVFHPNQYAPSSTCSSRDKWSTCWSKECLQTIISLWGCAYDDDKPCQQQFSKVLHQVRHPIHSIEHLNATFCSNDKLKPSFTQLLKGWFPQREWDSLSCLETMAWYDIDFHKTLIKARGSGLVHGIFQIEKTSPCEVAALAGFLDELSVVYTPNAAKTKKLCHDDSSSASDAQSRDTFTNTRKKNAGKMPPPEKLTFQDFEGGKHGSKYKSGDMTLVKELKKLVHVLGYDQDEDSEFL